MQRMFHEAALDQNILSVCQSQRLLAARSFGSLKRSACLFQLPNSSSCPHRLTAVEKHVFLSTSYVIWFVSATDQSLGGIFTSVNSGSSSSTFSPYIYIVLWPIKYLFCSMENAGSGCGNEQEVDPSRGLRTFSSCASWPSPCSLSTATKAQPHCKKMVAIVIF